MTTTRRTVLLQGAVIGAGLLSSRLPGSAALAASALPVRRSLSELGANDPVVAAYRDAVGILKGLDAKDPLAWTSLADIHRNHCPHGDWYFLPWHRAYVTMYEEIVRTVTKSPDFAMPYWDWTTDPVMPAVFTDPKAPDGKPNPLYVDEDGRKRSWPAAEPMPSRFVGSAVLQKILAVPTFEAFATTRNPGQKDLDPKWIRAGGGASGTLEALPHNNVHNLIGGWMPTMVSPRDPIFFAHHGNIDRIWAVWNLQHQNSTDKLWTDMPFADTFFRMEGGKPSPWSPKVSDVLDIAALGYSYGLPQPALSPSAAVLALTDRFSAVLAVPRAAEAGREAGPVASADVSGTARGEAPLAVPLNVPVPVLEKVASRPMFGAGVETMDFRAFNENAVRAPRALAFLRDVAVTDETSTLFRVFIGEKPVTAATPDFDPGYVGAFGVFGMPGMAGMAETGRAAEEAPSFLLDLTDAIGRVYGLEKKAALSLQILPVPNGVPGGRPVGTATLKRVEVFVV